MDASVKRLKLSCYATNVTMAIVGNLSPLLFLTFRSAYGLSYSLLGLLVVINFTTQLVVDLIFSFCSSKFNIPLMVKITPAIAVVGLCIYSVVPWVLPQYAYAGIVAGTVIFSAASGFAEVLISPVIAALPSKDPDREMSKLHSIYAWGVVGMVVFATLFLLVFKSESWHILALILALVPLSAFFLFLGSKVPDVGANDRETGIGYMLKSRRLWACVIAILLGGATEGIMAQWSSSYLEQALNIPKVWGDIFGVALFAVMLGLGRTLYAKRGKNIGRVIFFGGCGAVVCYVVAALTNVSIIGLVACALTGFCASMLWPGNLVVVADSFPTSGVFVYAIMAAGGDLGSALGPQAVGVVTDFVLANEGLTSFALSIGLSAEQFGMKVGMLTGALFPLAALPLFYTIYKRYKKKKAPSA